MKQTPSYKIGYRKGWRDAQLDADILQDKALAFEAAKVLGTSMSPFQLSQWRLGYYDARHDVHAGKTPRTTP